MSNIRTVRTRVNMWTLTVSIPCALCLTLSAPRKTDKEFFFTAQKSLQNNHELLTDYFGH